MRKQWTSGGAGEAEAQPSRAYLYALWSSLAFATMGALSHLAGERCDWRYVAAARTSLAFVFSAALALSTGVRLVAAGPRVLWMRSLAGSVGLLCAFYALTHLPVSTSLTLSNTVPVWVTLLAWPVLGHRPNASVWAAIGVGLTGVVLVQRPELSGGGLAGSLALFSALCTACAMIGLNRLGRIDARAVVTHFSGVSTVFALAFLGATGGPALLREFPRDAATLALLTCVGLAGTVGQIFMTRAFASGAPSRVSVVGLSQIVFALLFDLILWRRALDGLTVAGIFLVMAPSAWLIANNPLKREAPIHTTN